MLALILPRPVIRFARPYSTCIVDTTQLKQRMKRTSRRIQTLNRDLLTASDFVDFSHRQEKAIAIPPNTCGFLYWHHDPSLPPTNWGIRFRLVPEPDLTLFSTGTDLLYPNAVPWTIHLVSLARHSEYASIKAKLIADRLVDTASIGSLEKGMKGTAKHHWDSTIIRKLDQPFELDIPRHTSTIHIISPTRFGRLI
ncbi:hypothetical protein D9615_008513 [Tricholomella constricta]|uniref:Uncharacterized protein n=1 Tax=Tricholomella constricta TaxID=117010 RepID=A0A8H5M0F9_9AGAR|nr:hypothetical protein D9615_008513 [Tricholomella constricta]